MSKIRVMVVEDQPKILRSQLRLLQESPDIEIVATSLSGEAALEELEQANPKVILCDLGLPRMSGIDLTREIKARRPEIEVLIFTIFDEEDKVLDAVKAGASGYLLKGAPVERIVEAIRDVNDGGSVIQPNLARRLLKAFHVREDAQAAEPAPQQPQYQQSGPPMRELTQREVEILRLIAKGLSNNEAAKVLGLSRATVRTHLEHIYQKLEVTNRVEAVTEGIRKGLIAVE
jgi:DNA-binding NarL/FixJ family response regulator